MTTTAPRPEDRPTPAPRRTAVDEAHWGERLRVLAAEHGVPGAQLGILALGRPSDEGEGREPDRIALAACGVLNTETGHPVDTGSVFQIGSITKVWTATAIMRLVDEGRLTLDTPVAEVLPELRLSDPATTGRVLVRHLLTHTSGIDGDLFTDTGRGDDTLERYVALLSDAVLIHPLGATFSYCNSGFPVLGRVIERLTGGTWDAAMREALFAPLGLTHTGTLPEDALLHGAAVGHVRGLPDPVRAPVWGLPRSMGPAGLLTSTARDVLRFARMHLDGGLAEDGTRVLSEEGVRAMTEFQVDVPGAHALGDSWGLGWIRHDWNGHRLVGHDGNTIGQSAFLRVSPETGLAVVLLTNGGHASDLYHDLYREVFRDLAGIGVPDRPAPPPVPAEVDPAPVLGTYEHAALRMEVFARDGDTVMRTTVLGPLADVDPEPEQEHVLVPVEEGFYVVRPGGMRSWAPVTFYALPTGERYAHYGSRALPRLDDGTRGAGGA
ncbi:serine hydrolase [Streptomonospora nanhaiensis]|uniref:Serine hydrolase n=1 Tax=Streptomonospora nanhaiensis TaxID=1323731 RepID=A0ABY6YTR3_9ACTN|nr:serine hydrolase domain-containing protein [Streptomonospora nanhaiensis]WAE75780.1 serine hydrolase [Streptomonospora nanhaiensis]